MHIRWRSFVPLFLYGGASVLPACFNPSDGSPAETESGTSTSTGAGTVTQSSTLSSTASTTATATTGTETTDPATSADTSGSSGPATQTGTTSGTTSSTGGCVEDAESGVQIEPPELVAVEFVVLDEVLLTFSEPMEDPTPVQPEQFRLSAAESIYAPGPNPTYYNDLGFLDGSTISVTQIDFDPCVPEQFLLRLSAEITDELCQTVQSWIDPGGQTDGAIFVHYSSGGIASWSPVQDTSGDPLEDISPDWVLEPDGQLAIGGYGGHFPNMIPDLPIPCPP